MAGSERAGDISLLPPAALCRFHGASTLVNPKASSALAPDPRPLLRVRAVARSVDERDRLAPPQRPACLSRQLELQRDAAAGLAVALAAGELHAAESLGQLARHVRAHREAAGFVADDRDGDPPGPDNLLQGRARERELGLRRDPIGRCPVTPAA